MTEREVRGLYCPQSGWFSFALTPTLAIVVDFYNLHYQVATACCRGPATYWRMDAQCCECDRLVEEGPRAMQDYEAWLVQELEKDGQEPLWAIVAAVEFLTYLTDFFTSVWTDPIGGKVEEREAQLHLATHPPLVLPAGLRSATA